MEVCMYKAFLIFALTVGLAGCEAPKSRKIDWDALTGSRADATITLGYTYNPQAPQHETSDKQALEIAKNRCSNWGYPEAEPFGKSTKQCVQKDGKICVQMSVTRIYQCLGRGNSTIPDAKQSKQ